MLLVLVCFVSLLCAAQGNVRHRPVERFFMANMSRIGKATFATQHATVPSYNSPPEYGISVTMGIGFRIEVEIQLQIGIKIGIRLEFGTGISIGSETEIKVIVQRAVQETGCIIYIRTGIWHSFHNRIRRGNRNPYQNRLPNPNRNWTPDPIYSYNAPSKKQTE